MDKHIDKSDPPTTLGVFKPTGHTLMAFHTQDDLLAAMQQLLAAGFAYADMLQYSPEEMRQQAHAELIVASPISGFGYEVDLLRQHKRLADQGCSFLLVHTPHSQAVNQIAGLVDRLRPAAAQHYGRFLIQDLTEALPGLH